MPGGINTRAFSTSKLPQPPDLLIHHHIHQQRSPDSSSVSCFFNTSCPNRPQLKYSSPLPHFFLSSFLPRQPHPQNLSISLSISRSQLLSSTQLIRVVEQPLLPHLFFSLYTNTIFAEDSTELRLPSRRSSHSVFVTTHLFIELELDCLILLLFL